MPFRCQIQHGPLNSTCRQFFILEIAVGEDFIRHLSFAVLLPETHCIDNEIVKRLLIFCTLLTLMLKKLLRRKIKILEVIKYSFDNYLSLNSFFFFFF